MSETVAPVLPSVLICEDEGLTVLRLRRSLQRLGYAVCGEAAAGDEAVDLATRLAPDAILMDIRMPRMDGIEATSRIMADRPTAIVIISAFSDRELVEQALRAGASGYLVKPVSDEQIAPALSVALRRFEELRELQSEIADLKQALEARKVVERAKGILMRQLKLGEEDAYRRLQKLSRDRRQSLHATALQVISAMELLSEAG